MKDEVEKLLRLQSLDLRLDQLCKDRKELPERVAAAERARNRTREARGAKEKEIRKAELDQAAADKELRSNDEKIKRCLDREGTAKNDRELKAAQAEKEALQAANDSIGDRILPLMEQIPELKKEKKRLDAELDALESALAETIEESAREEKEIDSLLITTGEERERLAGRVEPSILSRYERIVRLKGPPGLARVERDACEVCYRAIPPQQIIEIRKMEQWIQCEGCGRMLVWKE
ncbi:MAG: hypothetical protein JW958_10835 [Candidatus Eisenbacteria bacterium]|nr:hypothetical protein [Candidatus Eisenbacteria bacterium]